MCPLKKQKLRKYNVRTINYFMECIVGLHSWVYMGIMPVWPA